MAPARATPPNVQNAIFLPYPSSKPRAESFSTTRGPVDRARQDTDADAPLTRARDSDDGVVFAILEWM